MPELPEVEHAARSLGAQIVGRTIVAVTRLDWERMVETPAVEQFLELLQGRQVLAAGRRAKWIVLTLDGGWTLALHLRMSGSVTVHGPTAQPDAYTHLALLLDDGRQVFFHDTRKFGRARLLDSARAWPRSMPPTASSRCPTRSRPRCWPSCCAAGARASSRCCSTSSVIAGIGNIYADEALWNAQLHPLRASDSLDDDEIARLHSGIRLALLQGLSMAAARCATTAMATASRAATRSTSTSTTSRASPARAAAPRSRRSSSAARHALCPFCQRLSQPLNAANKTIVGPTQAAHFIRSMGRYFASWGANNDPQQKQSTMLPFVLSKSKGRRRSPLLKL